MTESPFQMSQGFEVLPPKSSKAYPIPCDEWELLKTKISRATSEPWLFHTLGSALVGMGLSAIIPIATGTFTLPQQQQALNITWLILIASLFVGLACLYFAHEERKVNRERATDVAAQKQLIEQRYERSP